MTIASPGASLDARTDPWLLAALMAAVAVIGAALAVHLEALARTGAEVHLWYPADTNGQTLDDYLVGMHKVGTEQRTTDGLAKFIAKDALAMSNTWGVEQ